MRNRRANPQCVKLHRSYTAVELAERLGVHKNTIRHWQLDGLAPIDTGRPALFQGEAVRTFLAKRNAGRKRPCPPGFLYCFRCRQPRQPALGMVDYVEVKAGTGNLKALCETCEATMHRRIRQAAVATVMPGLAIQITPASPRLDGRPAPSLNCIPERHGAR